MLLMPGPVVKNEITKSSNDIVKAIKAPETIPGMISGTITLIRACHGVAPRSNAASGRLGSIWRSLGMMLSMT